MQRHSNRALVFVLVVLLSIPAAVGPVDAARGNAPSCGGGFSPSFRITGKVVNRSTFALDDLQAMPSTRQQVTYFSGGQGLVTTTYVGVPLGDLLARAVVRVDPAVRNDILRKFVVITGSDCYAVVVSLGEILSDFGGSNQIFVAYQDGAGQPLADAGMARLVVPGDIRGGRYVSNISEITVGSS
jgi:DMSO/TMAO reductase YedYZ molybdopterin-dependent catalytic subunit